MVSKTCHPKERTLGQVPNFNEGRYVNNQVNDKTIEVEAVTCNGVKPPSESGSNIKHIPTNI